MTIGVTTTGFSVPSNKELTNLVEAFLRDPTRFTAEMDWGKASPLRHVFEPVIELLSNKGLPASLEDSVYPIMWRLFFAHSLLRASGQALDFIGEYHNIKRLGAQKSTGYIKVTGTPSTAIPLGTEFTKDSDTAIKFVSTKAVTLDGSGFGMLPIAGEFTGAKYNTAAYTIKTFDPTVGGITSVVNSNENFTLSVGTTPDGWATIANDSGESNYQLIPVSDFGFFAVLWSATATVKNATANTALYDLQWAVIDDATGAVIIKSGVFSVTLIAGEQKTITTDGFVKDLSDYANVRMVLINHVNSDADIQVATKTSGAGAFYLNGVLQTLDMSIDVVSDVKGEIGGGLDKQDDTTYRQDIKDVFFLSSGATPNGLFSKISKIAGVRGKKVYPNGALDSQQVASGLTIPGKSVAVVVDGGDPDEIAKTIGDSGGGLLAVGTTSRFVQLTDGTWDTISFYLAQRILIQVQVTLTRKSDYPVGGDAIIKDAIIAYIGGTDSLGVVHSGIDIGESVSHYHVIKAIQTVGIKFADVRLAVSGGTLKEEPVAISPLDRAWTDLSLVGVI